MPRASALDVRQQVVDLHQQGQSPLHIAQSLSVSSRTVYRLLTRCRDQPGPQALQADYQRCGRALDPSRLPLHQACLKLRREHPAWGAGRLHIALRDQFPGLAIPAPRTLQRWLAQAGLAPPPALGQQPSVLAYQPTRPHEVWQIDAVEQLVLLDRSTASWLRVIDRFSGAILRTVVFPPRLLVQGPCQRCARRRA